MITKDQFLANMHTHMLQLRDEGELDFYLDHDDNPMIVAESWTAIHKILTYFAIEGDFYHLFIPHLDELEKSEYEWNRPKKTILYIVPGPKPEFFQDVEIQNKKEYRLIDSLRGISIPEPFDEWISEFWEVYGEYGFSDEYSRCSECGKFIKTSPDSYSWTPDFIQTEDGYVHVDCFDLDDALDTCKNQERNLPIEIQERAIDEGLLVELSDIEYENGMHPGMNDDPKIILRTMRKAKIDIWFNVEPSQFYVDFTILVKPEDEEKARKILEHLDVYQGYDTAEEMSKALRGEHSDHYHVETYTISPEDFINGNLPK